MPCAIEAQKRAGVAAILRVWSAETRQTLGAPDVQSLLQVAAADPTAQVEMLFMKRTVRRGDPWSGNVALPGGHRDPGDASDLAAAQREAAEEVGVHLATPGAYAVLGALDQRHIGWGRGARAFAMCPFVFLQLQSTVPPQRLQASEVAATLWVPLAALDAAHVQHGGLSRPLNRGMLPGMRWVPHWLLRSLGAHELAFPVLHLPYCGLVPEGPAESAHHLTTAAAGSVGARGSGALGSRTSPPGPSPAGTAALHTAACRGGGVASVVTLPSGASVAVHSATTGLAQAFTAACLSTWSQAGQAHDGDAAALSFDLWGLTLGVTSDVVNVGKVPPAPLNWPPLSFPGPLPSFLVAAAAGVTEVLQYPRKGANAWHLLAAASLAVPLLAGVAAGALAVLG